ncbi:MAG: crossover junction endodeoxyribonuclease RuvC [Bdellovibrionales bacterium]
MTVIGLDPGSRFTGFGVIQSDGCDWRHLEHGVVVIPEKLPFAARLNFLAQELRPLWGRHPKATTVVEKIFLGKNADSAFKLGHARGVCMMLAAENGGEVVEYAARQVKKVVTGNGSASKEHVQMVINQWLRIQVDMRADASDALAMALCHAQHLARQQLLARIEGANL